MLPSASHADAAAELQRIDASWNELRLKADTTGLARLLADDWLLTHSDGRTQTKADYLQDLSSRSRSNQGIVNEDVVVRLYGSAAVVTGVSVQSCLTNGQPWSGRFRFTRSWALIDGRWVMLASHSSRVTAGQ
ncbi:MAG: nuclear transport factor 2 family protein [Roseateles sp.]